MLARHLLTTYPKHIFLVNDQRRHRELRSVSPEGRLQGVEDKSEEEEEGGDDMEDKSGDINNNTGVTDTEIGEVQLICVNNEKAEAEDSREEAGVHSGVL